jgi:cysteinyl-tRNA synthetase
MTHKLTILNSLTKLSHTFTPKPGDELRIYSCGPTVYDSVHIGNLFSFIFADTLKRVAQICGYNVHHVMNYTDVDDKTIRRAATEYPEDIPNEALRKSTEHYINLFMQDLEKIGYQTKTTQFIKATNHVAQMQKLIIMLLEKKIAYIADDGIYFSIEAYKSNGGVYGNLVELTTPTQAQARISNDEYDKDNAQDFALWKYQKPSEPSWEFLYNGISYRGRPGWHIECSAMAYSQFGHNTFDIHTGGVDLKFPHHENEIAQTCGALSINKMANVFAHNEDILIDGKKMSKSLNNFYTLNDVVAHGYRPLDFRLLVLQGGYGNQAHFTWENLTAAAKRLDSLYSLSSWVPQLHQDNTSSSHNEHIEFLWPLIEALADNLNMPKFWSELSPILDRAVPDADSELSMQEGIALVTLLNDALGLCIPASVTPDEVSLALLQQRANARVEKDYELSDSLRTELLKNGVTIVQDKIGEDLFTKNKSVRQIWHIAVE